MRIWLVHIFLCLMPLGLLAQQGAGEALPVEKQVADLTKSNNALQKELSRLKNKLGGMLDKKLASLDPNQLDSLVNFQIPRLDVDSLNNLANGIQVPNLQQAAGLNQLETTSDKLMGKMPQLQADSLPGGKLQQYLGLSLKPSFIDSLKGLAPDGELARLDALQQDLLAKTQLTPPNLDIAQDLQVSIKELEELKQLYAKLQVPELNQPGFAEGLQKNTLPKGRFDKAMKRGSALQEELTAYTSQFENWDQKLLEQVTSLEEVALIQKQIDRIDSYEFLPEGYRKNMEGMQTNDFVKKQLQAKAEELERAGAKSLQEKFDEAQAKITEAKEKFPALESVENAPKRPPNPYAGEPFLKRLKLGFNFQANRQDPASLDLALNVSYLLNKNARFGLGGSYRIGLEENLGGINFDDQVYGIRSFFDYTFFRSFYAEALYEWSSTSVPTLQNDDTTTTQWVPGGMLGVGNRFRVTKKLSGNAVMLYNFLHDADSPNPSPWVFRFGFEF